MQIGFEYESLLLLKYLNGKNEHSNASLITNTIIC